MKKLFIAFDRDDVELDVETDLEHTLTATATKYPVETGEKVSDHITVEPVAFSVDGVVSDGTPPGPNLTPEGPDRHRAVFARLQRALNTRELCAVVSDLQRFESMAIVKVAASQSTGTASAVTFKLAFEQVRLATAKTATYKPALKHGAKRAKVKAPPVTATAARSVTVNGKLVGSLKANGQVVPQSLVEEQTQTLVPP